MGCKNLYSKTNNMYLGANDEKNRGIYKKQN